jgi:hypothetical protein
MTDVIQALGFACKRMRFIELALMEIPNEL